MVKWSEDPQGYIRERSEAVPFSGCWLWTQHTVSAYGRGQVDGRSQAAHRLSYRAFVGPIPAGKVVCHRCDVPSCVNPHHLFLGTQADNVADMNSKGRGVIPRGERNGNAKLTLEQVLAIEADTRLQRVIAKEYGVVQQTVSNIKRGTHWSQRNAA